MSKKQLIEIVENQAKKYKDLKFNDLKYLIEKNGEQYEINYNNKKYWFEIEANYFKNEIIRVMICGEPTGLFGWTKGFAIHFGKTKDNKIIENDDMIF